MSSLKRAVKELNGSLRKNYKTPQGNAGYDNARENIDPHVRTKAVSTKEFIGQTLFTNTADIVHTATETDDHALEIDADAAGFGDVKAVNLDYITGNIALGDDEAVNLVNIDQSLATGGEVFGLEVIPTEGNASVKAVKAGALVHPIHQDSGVFADMDSALVNGIDKRTELITAGNDIEIFSADNDTITIGHASKFEEIEFLLATESSKNIKPAFEFSNGIGFTTFTPVDGTNGIQNNGVIAWDDEDIPTWATNGGEYKIRITRTRNQINTPPIESKVQIASVVKYTWDAKGNLDVNHVSGATFSGNGSALTGITGGASLWRHTGTNYIESVSGTNIISGAGLVIANTISGANIYSDQIVADGMISGSASTHETSIIKMGAYVSRNFGTTYQAETDGFVQVVGTATIGTALRMAGQTSPDGSAWTTRARLERNDHTLWSKRGSLTFPVPKGDYYTVSLTTTGSPTTAMWWFPMRVAV